MAVNEAIDPHQLRRLTMSSAKLFSQSLLRAGKNAIFSKTDISDAYKLIPCHPTERPFFAFTWLGKIFFDISTPFGSKAAPANFDDFAETIVNICVTITGLSREWIHRQLDDVPVVTPGATTDTEKFFTTYQEVCSHLRIPLGADDPARDKTFSPGVTGTVLGLVASIGWHANNIYFASQITWPLSILELAEAHSTFLEFIGLLLPIIAYGKHLSGHIITLFVDNSACCSLWHSKVCHDSEIVSMLIQCLHMLQYALQCQIFVEYVPRRSTFHAILVDNLSRLSSTTQTDRRHIATAFKFQPRGPLLDWLLQPTPDWSFPHRLAQFVYNTVP